LKVSSRSRINREECPRTSNAEIRVKFVAEQPDNLVLELLRGLRTEVGGLKADVQSLKAELRATREEMATKAGLKADLNSLRADVASDLLNMQKETREQIVGVRRALIEYHSSVVGHGMLISELQDRVRRIEQHLDLPPPGTSSAVAG
jgi:hypothetical protein